MPLESQNWFNPSKGEEVLWYSHPSFVFRLPHLLLGVLVAIIGVVTAVYIYFFQDWPVELAYVALTFVPIGLGYSAVKMIVFKNTWYVITNRRVLMKTGVVGRDSSSKPHREIVRVDVRVSTIDAIVSRLTTEDIGDIVIRTADDSGDKFILKRVPEVGLSESYIERLSGTGPDTPAAYDAEERDRLKHEEFPEGESRRPGGQRRNQGRDSYQERRDRRPRQQDRPADPEAHQSASPKPNAGREGDGSSYGDSEGGPERPESPAPEPTDDEFDDLDEFEPSDKA